MTGRAWMAVAFAVMMTAAAGAQDGPSDAADANAAAAEAAEAAVYDFAALAPRLTGDWDGVLTARVGTSSRREETALRLTWTAAGDGAHLAGDLAFLEPEAFVHVVTQPVGGQGVRVTSFREGEVEIALRRVTAYEPTDDGWTVVYEEQGQDEGRAALLRYTETLDGDSYLMRKEAQRDGANDFGFRAEISLTRADGS